MKVLLVNKFHYRKGGSETYYFDVAEGLRSMGHEVVFFAMEGPENEPCGQSEYFVSARDYNGDTSILQKVKDAVSLIYSKEAKDKFERLLQAERPDVIHLNLTHRQITFSILDAPSAKGVPVVYTAHDYVPVCPNAIMLDNEGRVCEECLGGSFGPCVRKKCVKGSAAKSALAALEASFLRKRHVYEKIDRVIAPSEFMRTKLLEGGFSPDQVIEMQNFAPTDLIEHAETVGGRPKEDMFLFFGRLSREKGVDIVVRAFAHAASSLPSTWRLVIAGDGPERDEIERLIAESGCSERIEMVGRLDKSEMAEYVERASLSIASSRCRENMPYSVIESFAAGTPVIASRIGGLPELVKEGRTGFLAEPGDVSDFARALCKAADFAKKLPTECLLMRRQCRSYVKDRCAQDAYMAQLVKLYVKLLDRGKATVSECAADECSASF